MVRPKSVRKSPKKNPKKSVRKSSKKSPKKNTRKSPRKSLNKSTKKNTRKYPRKSYKKSRMIFKTIPHEQQLVEELACRNIKSFYNSKLNEINSQNVINRKMSEEEFICSI